MSDIITETEQRTAPRIHPSAQVDPGAELDATVIVGPWTIIGPNVRVGAGTEIGANVLIEKDTTVGESLHQVGYCLSSQGKYAEALAFYEEAISAMRKGDIHGRVDKADLASSQAAAARAREALGRPDAPRAEAAAAGELGEEE